MHRRLIAGPVAVATLAAAGIAAHAATTTGSGAQHVTVPAAGHTTTITWKGTIPAGANPTSDCTTDAPNLVDDHAFSLAVPAGYYRSASLKAQFRITWTPTTGNESTNDEILTVLDPSGGELGNSDTSGPESVGGQDLAAGTYHALACGYANAQDQPYTGTLTLTATKKQPLRVWPTGGITATRETVADPFRLGTEPTHVVAADGTVYESQIFGFSTTQSFLQRSDDGGATFRTLSLLPGVGKLDQCTGGGDSAVATDRFAGDVWMIDLGGAPEVPARVSHDHGATWSSACEANFHDGANYFTDRQWLSTDYVHHKMLYIYRDGLLTPPSGVSAGSVDVSRQAYGEYVKTAPLPRKAGTAGTPQITFDSLCTQAGVATPCVTDVEIAGPPVTDNAVGTSRYAGTTYLPIETTDGLRVVRIDPGNAKQPYVESAVVKDKHQVLFPVVAVDRAGTVYLAWTDSTTYQVDYVWSKDQGRHWSAPVQVNGAPAATTAMPTIVAGDAGRIDVAFYGSAKTQDPTHNAGPWYVYLAQSLDATSAHPSFAQARMSDRPNHIDPICLSGLGCTTDTGPAGDRELGDFFTVGLDRYGRATISFADGDNQLGKELSTGESAAPSFAHFVRQATGPSLYAKVGKVPPLPVPTGGVSAKASGSGLALTSSRAGYDRKGDLVVRLTANDLAKATGPVTTLLTRFVHDDAVYAVGAEVTGGSWRFFAGPAAPVSDGLAVKYAYYPATTSVQGVVKGNTVTITVPRSAIGSPKAGATLYAVTSYVLTHAVPTAPLPPQLSNYSDFPVVADVLPPYNTH